MTQTITNLGEIGADTAMLTPIDLPLQRDGAVWDLTGYTTPIIDVWELRTRSAVVSPGTVAIQDAATGVIRWTPTAASFASGVYEARIKVTLAGKVEPSGLFRFSIGAAEQT